MPYAAITAQNEADRRRKNTNKRKMEKLANKKLEECVKKKLERGWSPEQIDGKLKKHPPKKIQECRDKTISYESIYDYIYNGQERFGGLCQNLRRKQCQRKRRFSRKIRPNSIKNRISINDRKNITNNRKRFGDWETDSVIFSRGSILYETKIHSYFCDPYKSWRKGGVENLNGLIRKYFPKKSNLDIVSKKEIYLIQEKLNNRPRKCLNYQTPSEVIAIELEKGALNS